MGCRRFVAPFVTVVPLLVGSDATAGTYQAEFERYCRAKDPAPLCDCVRDQYIGMSRKYGGELSRAVLEYLFDVTLVMANGQPPTMATFRHPSIRYLGPFAGFALADKIPPVVEACSKQKHSYSSPQTQQPVDTVPDKSAKYPFLGKWVERDEKDCSKRAVIITEKRWYTPGVLSHGYPEKCTIGEISKTSDTEFLLTRTCENFIGGGDPFTDKSKIFLNSSDRFDLTILKDNMTIQYNKCPSDTSKPQKSPQPQQQSSCPASIDRQIAQNEAEWAQIKSRSESEALRPGGLPQETACAAYKGIAQHAARMLQALKACKLTKYKSYSIDELNKQLASRQVLVAQNCK